MHTSCSNQSTRVLFLCWGYSIHAWRRIKIFAEDPCFDVAVASTYPYQFDRARTILLPSGEAHLRPKTAESRQEAQGGFTGNKHGLKSCLHGILSHENAPGFLSAPFHVYRLVRELMAALKDLKHLKEAVKNFNPDVVFLQTLLYPCYLSYFLPQSIPIMITFWNGDVTWWAKWNGIERLLKKYIVTYGVRRARALTVNSQTAYDACLNYGVGDDALHIIRYPGVDLRLFLPMDKNQARQDLSISAEKVILWPRGFGGFLNSDVMIAAFAKILPHHADTLLLITSDVGGAEEYDKHLEHARRLGIDGHIRWDGRVDWERMPLYYNASDVMVSLSSNDSLPNCMLESMACGLPVIMGDIPQTREWVEGEFRVPPRNADILAERITDLLAKSPEEIRTIGVKYLSLMQNHFGNEQNIERIKQLVHKVAHT